MHKNIPNIRFKEFEGEWEERPLSESAGFSKGQGYSKSDIKNEGVPLLLYGSLYTDYRTNIDGVGTYTSLKNGSVISKGDEVVVPASGETAEDIARASAIHSKGIVIGGDLNIIHPDNSKINSGYLALEITYGKSHNDLVKRAQGISVVHLHNSDIQALNITIPTLSEQQKIGDFFQQLDELIGAKEQELEKLRQMKRALLDKMFPGEDENTPPVRFKGFTEPWERYVFGNELKAMPYKQYIKQPEQNGRYPVIQQGDEPFCGRANGNPITDYQDKVVFGDHTVSLFLPTCPFFAATDGLRIFSIEGMSQQLLYVVIQKYGPAPQGYTRHTSFLYENHYCVPKSKQEQRLIGDFFRSYDAAIISSAEEIAKLRTLRRACLQQMFA